jgi:hypothetical protein
MNDKQYGITAREGTPKEKIKSKLWLSNTPTGYIEDKQLFIFEKEIIWLLDAEATVKCYHNNVELYKGETHSDFYGYLTCLKNLKEENYKSCLENLAIDDKSTLEVAIELKIDLVPCLASSQERTWEDIENFLSIPENSWLLYNGQESEDYYKMTQEEKWASPKKVKFLSKIEIYKEKVLSSFNDNKDLNMEDLNNELIKKTLQLMEDKLNELYPNRKVMNKLKNI